MTGAAPPSRPGVERRGWARLAGLGAVLFALRAGQALMGLAALMVLSRALDEADLARALLLLSLAGPVGVVGQFGLDVALLRRLSGAGATGDLVGRFALLWLALAAFAAADVPSALWASAEAATGLARGWLIAWAFLAAAQQVQASILLGLGRRLAAVVFGGLLSSLLAAVFVSALFLRAAPGLSVLALAQTAALTASLAAGWLAVWRGGLVPAGPGMRAEVPAAATGPVSWRAMGAGALTNALALAGGQLALWTVALLGTPADVIALGLAQRLLLPLALLGVAARSLAAPAIARAAATGRPDDPGPGRISALALIAGAAIALAVLVAGDPLARWAFGREAAVSLPVLAALAAGHCLQLAAGPGQLALRLFGREAEALALSAALVAGQAVLAAALVARFGAFGAALAMSAHLGLATLLPSVRVRARFGLDVSVRGLRRGAAPAAPAGRPA